MPVLGSDHQTLRHRDPSHVRLPLSLNLLPFLKAPCLGLERSLQNIRPLPLSVLFS